MTNERFTEIARKLFCAGNIQVLTNDEYKEFIKECRRTFIKMPTFEIIKFIDGDYIAFRELIY